VRNVLYRPVEARGPAKEPRRSLGARLALGGGVAALLAIPFLFLLLLVEGAWTPLQNLDEDTASTLNDLGRSDQTLVDVLRVGADVMDPWVFRVAVLLVAAWLWRRGARRLAAWAVVTMAIGGLLGLVLKLLVERARPHFPEPVAHASGYSFPSGHALNSFLGVGVLLLVFLPVLTRTGRLVAYAVGAAVVLFTGFDRVGLGVHYVSDVVGGWIAALAVLAGTAAAFEIWRREQGHRPSRVDEGVDPEAAPDISDG
jgi:undecaprenyl-diphosphatase